MSEAIYDAEIAPRLLEVMKLCRQHGMPFVATVEYLPGEYGTSADLPAPDQRSLPMDWSYVAGRSQGNADILIGHLVKQASERGHGSMFLRMCGVEPEGERNVAR